MNTATCTITSIDEQIIIWIYFNSSQKIKTTDETQKKRQRWTKFNFNHKKTNRKSNFFWLPHHLVRSDVRITNFQTKTCKLLSASRVRPAHLHTFNTSFYSEVIVLSFASKLCYHGFYSWITHTHTRSCFTKLNTVVWNEYVGCLAAVIDLIDLLFGPRWYWKW